MGGGAGRGACRGRRRGDDIAVATEHGVDTVDSDDVFQPRMFVGGQVRDVKRRAVRSAVAGADE